MSTYIYVYKFCPIKSDQAETSQQGIFVYTLVTKVSLVMKTIISTNIIAQVINLKVET